MGVRSTLVRKKWGNFDDWLGEDSTVLASGRAKEEGALVTCRMIVGVTCRMIVPHTGNPTPFPEVTKLWEH